MSFRTSHGYVATTRFGGQCNHIHERRTTQHLRLRPTAALDRPSQPWRTQPVFLRVCVHPRVGQLFIGSARCRRGGSEKKRPKSKEGTARRAVWSDSPPELGVGPEPGRQQSGSAVDQHMWHGFSSKSELCEAESGIPATISGDAPSDFVLPCFRPPLFEFRSACPSVHGLNPNLECSTTFGQICQSSASAGHVDTCWPNLFNRFPSGPHL